MKQERTAYGHYNNMKFTNFRALENCFGARVRGRERKTRLDLKWARIVEVERTSVKSVLKSDDS